MGSSSVLARLSSFEFIILIITEGSCLESLSDSNSYEQLHRMFELFKKLFWTLAWSLVYLTPESFQFRFSQFHDAHLIK